MTTKTIAIRLVPAALGMAFAVTGIAATTDLATGPLVTSTSTSVLPNLFVVMDDSGSMAWDFMPDLGHPTGADNHYWIFSPDSYGYASAQCNGVYYDPTIKYTAPVKADGTSYTDATFTAAWIDGYRTSKGTVNLDTNFALELSYDDGPPSSGSAAFYYTYSGSQTTADKKKYYDSSSTFYKECSTDRSTASSVFKKVTLKSTTNTAADLQNFANWFSYYRTRVNMMKSGMGLAFKPIDTHYRVGFATMNNNNDKMFVNVDTFDTTQKASFYTKLYSVKPSNSTPLLTALSKAGRLYADKLTSYNNVTVNDPVQYACQKNFTLLSTDGFWNDQTTYNLDGNAVGNVDSGYPRPYTDGGSATITTATPTKVTTVEATPRTVTNRTTHTDKTTWTSYRKGTGTITKTEQSLSSCSNGNNKIVTKTSYGTGNVTESTNYTSSQAYTTDTVTNYTDTSTTVKTTTETVVMTDGVVTSDTTKDETTTPVKDSKQVGDPSITNTPVGAASVTNDPAVLTGDPSSVKTWSTPVTVSTSSCMSNAVAASPTYAVTNPTGLTAAPDSAKTTVPGNPTTDPDYPMTVTGTVSIATSNPEIGAPTVTVSGASGGTPNTLADVAMYYYINDLRTPTMGNCTGAQGGTVDVCDNVVDKSSGDSAVWQHMTTFTLGLGAPGKMTFVPGYDIDNDANKGSDYYYVKNGLPAQPSLGKCSWGVDGKPCNWPVPNVAGVPENIDDLWHAAVNGRGKYFSATNPLSLAVGLSNALASVNGKTGDAAAATVSNPNVSKGDNFVFSSTFISGTWEGQLIRQELDVDTGQVLPKVNWTVADQLDANTSRTVYTYSSSAANKLKPFKWDQLNSTEQGYFSKTSISTLSQFCTTDSSCLSAADQTSAAGQPLVEYIAGARTNEGDASDPKKYYRLRKHVLGDIVNSEAVYVKRSLHEYADTGYSAFITANESRAGAVYVGANDGMLHAFNADDGSELWAYVPSFVMPSLYKLADKNYSGKHQYFVDGTPTIDEVYFDSAWHTILVGGLNSGGRGYYAIDVTDRANPKVLWEFSNTDLGFTFGNPKITKLKNGTWVVIVTSGYNNVNNGDGKGHLWVLNAKTGAIINSYNTNVGGTSAPSGLARIAVWTDNPSVDNTGLYAYGGDMLGNLWRFDINNGSSTPLVVATLKDPNGNAQPITAKPELGRVNGERVVFVGTGRYLGMNDLADTQKQSFYAIRDNLAATATTGFGNPRDTGAKFVQQTINSTYCPASAPADVCLPGESVRTGSNNSVNYATSNGWYIDLPDSGERDNTDPALALGTITFTANVPKSDACTAGGYSYSYYLDYRTGAPVSTAGGVVANKTGNAIGTRGVLVGLPNGSVISVTGLGNGDKVIGDPKFDKDGTATRRVSWRELTTDK